MFKVSKILDSKKSNQINKSITFNKASMEFGERPVKRSLKIKTNIQDTPPSKKSILCRENSIENLHS
jgi:hypothetical protein